MGTHKRRAGVVLAVAFALAAASACTSTHHSADAPASVSSPPLTSAAARSSSTTPAGPTTTKPPAPSGSRNGPVRPSSAPTSPGGAEGATEGAVGECKITSSETVASAYGGKIGSESAGTSGIGNPICQFSLTKSNAAAPGHVSITVNASMSAAAFAKLRKQAQGAVTVQGIGDNAFYIPGTATMQFIKGRTAVVIQADLRLPHGMPPMPIRVRADTATLARLIAADL